jgi:SAM-dependent methyltransferase
MSMGSGDCSLEVALAGRLRERSIAARVACVDFNAELLARGAEAARRQGLADAMEFLQLDCNRLPELPPQDAIVVNQFFHHIENLEGFCLRVRQALRSGGRLVACDVIGRNGHLLWPDVEREVAANWATLPADRRFDRYFDAVRERYQPVNHAAYSNEGIRAQDVVHCLLEQFDFEIFLSYGGAIIPFVERRIGFNFDPESPEDRAFIDRVAQADVEALAAGRYPAANMIAALVPKGEARQSDFEPIAPSAHAVLTREQASRVAS